MTAVAPKKLKKNTNKNLSKSELLFAEFEPRFDAAMCHWRLAPLLSLCLTFTYLNMSDYRLE